MKLCDSAEILPLTFIACGSPLRILEWAAGGPALSNGCCKWQGSERAFLDSSCE